LAKVWALAADLEGEPLIAQVLLLEGLVAEHVLSIVLFDDVLEDCAGLPEGEAGVWVFDG
jgi:hypothetical protein